MIKRTLKTDTYLGAEILPQGTIIEIKEYNPSTKKYLVDFSDGFLTWVEDHMIEDISNVIYLQ